MGLNLFPVYEMKMVKKNHYAFSRPCVEDPQALIGILDQVFQEADRELFVVVLLDHHNKLIGVNTVATGTTWEVYVGIPELFKAVFLANAQRFIVAHNHPVSGDPRPSQNDWKKYQEIQKAAEIMQITFLDSIVAGDTYYSMRGKAFIG